MTTLNARIVNSYGENEALLICPLCPPEDQAEAVAYNAAYTHQEQVEVYLRQEDAESELTIIPGEDGEAYPPMGNPSGRRQGIRIWLWCEICGGRFTLNISQHKGQTLVSCTAPPPDAPLPPCPMEDPEEEC